MLALLGLLGCGWLQTGPVAPPGAVDREQLVELGGERERLTLAYAHAHTGPDQGVDIVPRMVVLHGTMDRDFQTHFDRLRGPSLPEDREGLAWAGQANVAVHFVVERDGTVTRVLPETHYGRHTVGFNHLALGIEHIGDGPEHDLTEAQVTATASLIRELSGRHPLTHLAGHHQLIEAPERHPLFLEQVDDYRTFALDPGDAFVARVAAKVSDLGLVLPTVEQSSD